MKFSINVILCLCMAVIAYAQSRNQSEKITIPTYVPHFEFKNSKGEQRDTMLPPFMFNQWSKSKSFPTYIHWNKQHFAIIKTQNGFTLCTDSITTFKAGDTIGYSFYKTSVPTGRFNMDYKKSFVSMFLSDSQNPNMIVALTPRGLVFIATRNIEQLSSLTYSYQQVINLFQNDPTVKMALNRN